MIEHKRIVMNKPLIIISLTLFSAIRSSAQSVDYSVVSVNQEAGVNLTKISSDNHYVCMPEVIRNRDKIEWFTNRIIDISPDGTKLAYLSFRSNTTNIFIKDINKMGGSIQRTNRQNVLDFSYSPDGKNLCFSEMVNGVNRIFVTDANKGFVCRQITNNEKDYTPVYSDDMNQIYFSRQEANGLSIWSYSVNDNFLSSITNGMNPCPIKDETAILCVRPSGNGRNEIWKVNYDTGVEECIVSDANHSFTTPSVSPDGKWIIFVGSSKIEGNSYNYSNRDNYAPRTSNYLNTDIFACRIDGTGLTQITYHAADDISPVWSRDGKFIYFISQRGSSSGTANIWRMNFTL